MAAFRCSCQYLTASVVAGAVLLLLLGNIAGIVSIISIFEDTKTANYTDYGVVIDAGSSHSTLWIFAWDGLKEHSNTGKISAYARIKGTDVGINQYAGNASAAAESISALVTRADAIVGSVKNRTWLYLGATAGMRLLEERNKTAATEIMNEVHKALIAKKFFATNTAIIPGMEEASSSWTSVNFLNQTLLAPGQTVGSIDFGGASLELAFESVSSNETVTFFNHSHTLYAHSYLCYGRDQMELRLLANLAQDVREDNRTVENPCLPQGFQMNKTVADIWSHPCAITQPPSNLTEGDLVFFNGTSDSARCAMEVDKLFPKVSCDFGTCGINGTFQPLVNGTYYAMGLFKVISSKLPELQSSSADEWTHFNQTVESWCQANLTELRALYPGEQDSHIAELCFDGRLMWSTLLGGLNFSRSSTLPWTVKFDQSISGVPLGWPMGYMTLKTNTILTNDAPYGYDRIFSFLDLILSVVLLSIVAVILALLFIASVRVCLLMRPQAHLGYTPLD